MYTIKKYTNPISAVTNCVTENVICKPCSFSLFFGRMIGSSNSEIVRPIKHPFAKADKTAVIIERAFISRLFFVIAGLKKKWTIKTKTIFPNIIKGIVSRIDFGLIKKAVTGAIPAKMSPHIRPAVTTARIRHRLTIGPVI